MINDNHRIIGFYNIPPGEPAHGKGYIEARIKFDNAPNYCTIFEINFLRFSVFSLTKFFVSVYTYPKSKISTNINTLFNDTNKIQVSFDENNDELVIRILTSNIYFTSMSIKEDYFFSYGKNKIDNIVFSHHLADDFPAI